jgi:hypothetical protein
MRTGRLEVRRAKSEVRKRKKRGVVDEDGK